MLQIGLLIVLVQYLLPIKARKKYLLQIVLSFMLAKYLEGYIVYSDPPNRCRFILTQHVNDVMGAVLAP